MGKPSILIVDDSALVRFQLSDILADIGFEIAGTASNGIETVSLYKEKKPDFVTLDILMPEKDGIQTLKELLAINPKVHVIMITVVGKKETVVECIKLGARDFIVKPFNAVSIKDIFENILKRITQKNTGE